MSELESDNLRTDRKYPTFIRLRILLFPISVVLSVLTKHDRFGSHPSEVEKSNKWDQMIANMKVNPKLRSLTHYRL